MFTFFYMKMIAIRVHNDVMILKLYPIWKVMGKIWEYLLHTPTMHIFKNDPYLYTVN